MLVTCQCCHRTMSEKGIGLFVILVDIEFVRHVFPVIAVHLVLVDISAVSVPGGT